MKKFLIALLILSLLMVCVVPCYSQGGRDYNARILRVSKWIALTGRIYNTIIIPFVDGDTTPSVYSGNVFKTANTGATVITTFDNSIIGQQIAILFTDANTTIDFTGTNLLGNGGVDWTSTVNDILSAAYDGTNWYCDLSNTSVVSGAFTVTGTLTVGTGGNTFVLDPAAGPTYSGTARPTRYFSDLLANKADSSASGAVTIVGDHDGTGNKDYDRVSSGSGAQAGVIVKKWRVPENFAAWTGSASISIWTRSSDFTNCTFVVTLEDGSGNVDGTISGSDISPGSDNTWVETTLEPGTAVTPGETIRLIFTGTNAQADDSSDLGSDVTISYLASN